MGYRILACLILICSVLGLLGIVLFGTEQDLQIEAIPMVIAPLVLVYVTIPIVFTGYAPKLLRWTMGKREQERKD